MLKILNFLKQVGRYGKISRFPANPSFARNAFNYCTEFVPVPYRNAVSFLRLYPTPSDAAKSKFRWKGLHVFTLGLSILNWLGFEKEDEDKESELITTLKRAVLAKRRQEFSKAEQLLHIALRLAQQQHNEQGITYCYDLMANLALDTLQLDKAEKLFTNVLQRLLGSGVRQDDLKVIHISLKLARILHLKAEEEKAEVGYTWCLQQVEKHSGIEARELYGIIKDWYAQFLLDRGDVTNSLSHLQDAYSACIDVMGKHSEQSMLILNDLGITSWRAGDLRTAEKFLQEAIEIGQLLEDKTHVGVVHANLGLILLQKGMTDAAKRYCKDAWHIGKRAVDEEAVQQANYCFDQIKFVSDSDHTGKKKK